MQAKRTGHILWFIKHQISKFYQRHHCRNGATCSDGEAQFSCLCPPGYTGPLCGEDVDECAVFPCLHGGTCTDQVAGYTCTCRTGYTGDNCQVCRIKQIFTSVDI